MPDCDVLVLGAGPNGLGISGLLAKDNFKVINLEKNDFVGGMGSNSHFWPGFTHNTGAWWLSYGVIKPVWNALGLDKYDCQVYDPPLHLATVLGRTPDEKPFHMYNNIKLQLDKVRESWGPEVADNFIKFFKYFEPFSMGVKPMVDNLPLSIGQVTDRMPSIEARHLMNQIFYGNFADLLNEYFPDEDRFAAVRGYFTANVSDGFWGGPMTTGSNLMFAYHSATHSPEEGGGLFKLVKGGIGKFSDALASALKDFGGKLILKAEVKKILVENGKATGVELMNGDIITAKYVISSLDAPNTFLRLVGEANVPSFVAKQIKGINNRCHFMQMFCTVNALPEFKGKLDYFNTEGWRWSVGYWPTMELSEKCFDAVKFGKLPEQPMGAFSLQSVLDPTLAPPGKHIMTIFSRHIWPWGVPADKVDEVKEICYNMLIDTFTRFAPNFREIIDDHLVTAPPDYEKRFNVTGGDWTHGMMQVSQLFNNRPIQGMANYKVPFIGNMWLCGSSCHPGPGINFRPALNCLNVFKKEIGFKK
jgi:phytoene dehydrogenase-like protein